MGRGRPYIHRMPAPSEIKRLDQSAVTWFDLPFPLEGEPALVGDDLWLPFREIVTLSELGTKRTDHDRFGLIRVSLSGPPFEFEAHALNENFPPMATAGRGAKRSIEVLACEDGRIGLEIHDPSVEQGPHAFVFDTRSRSYARGTLAAAQAGAWKLPDLDREEFRDWFDNVERRPADARWTVFATATRSYEIHDPKKFLKFASNRLRALGIGSVRSLGNYRVTKDGSPWAAILIRVALGGGKDEVRFVDSLVLVEDR